MVAVPFYEWAALPAGDVDAQRDYLAAKVALAQVGEYSNNR